jgi:glycosyltransferase involved in cell wall biosynthesis
MPPIDPVRSPGISVVIPVYNGAEFLTQCLQAVFASHFDSFEVIVVDDGSTDESVAIARRFPCTLVRSPANLGPAAARNIGAREARGEVLFFLDADNLVEPGALAMIAATLAADYGLAALFGSYGRKTLPDGFFSRYKNLLRYYTHQHSRERASTFCSGFGAIRRTAFDLLGGFDPECRFLEDVELGYRMSRLGMRVRLCKELQFTHCKRYTFSSLVRSDLFGRAIPWTRLLLQTGMVRNDLNTQWNNVLSVPAAFLLPVVPCLPAAAFCFPALLAVFVACNARFLWLTYSEVGVGFAIRSCLMCWFGYIYSGIGVAMGIAAHWQNRFKPAAIFSRDLPES